MAKVSAGFVKIYGKFTLLNRNINFKKNNSLLSLADKSQSSNFSSNRVGWVHHISDKYHIPDNFVQPISNHTWMFICFVVYLYKVKDFNFLIITIFITSGNKTFAGMTLKWRRPNISHHSEKYHPNFIRL